MSIKMVSPVGKKVMDIRKEDVQLYLGRGYKYVDEPADLETVEMMSPAGQVVIMKKDAGDYLNREGWSLLEPDVVQPVEDETPVLPIDAAPVEEPELVSEPEPEPIEAEPEPETVETETETVNEVSEEMEAQMEE